MTNADLLTDFQRRAGFLVAAELATHLAMTLTSPDACSGNRSLADRWLNRRFNHDGASELITLLHTHNAVCDCSIVDALGVRISKTVRKAGSRMASPNLGLVAVTLDMALDGWKEPT